MSSPGGAAFTIEISGDGPSVDFHGNHILNGGGLTIRAGKGGGTPAVVMDLTGNYWGTSDSTQIADWIYDHSDADTGILVNFSSFSEQPIPVERSSFARLKAGH